MMKMRLLFLSVLLLPAVIGSGEGGSGDNNDSVVSESLLSTQPSSSSPPPPLLEATGVEREEGQFEMRSNFTQKQLESNSDNDGGGQPSFTGLLNG
jgi:hypothetical protein